MSPPCEREAARYIREDFILREEHMSADAQTVPETHHFQAEVTQLLHLMVHSVYSETEIFLRELISNASDACDRLRYEAIAKPELLGEAGALAIRIKPDADARTLTMADTGIGMDRQELIDNLGTVARSGTRAFVERLSEAKDGAGLIGKFGVGFYSAFMVSDRIEVVSRRAGAGETWVWRSSGEAGFEITPATEQEAARVPRGTEIVLHLKEDAKRYLESYDIQSIVKTYSDHIQFPIELLDKDGKPKQINAASAIWQRPKSELKPEDYSAAYRAIAGTFDEPAMTLHYKAEGRQSYAVLLFAPSTKPFDLFDAERKAQVKLYVRRVYITDDAELLPAYLRFVRGVIDSEDMPLNISREMLQNNPHVELIRKAVTGRVVSELQGLAAKEPEKKADEEAAKDAGEDGKTKENKFAAVWEAFGRVLKEGIYEDHERREALLALSRFATTKGGELRTLKQYAADLRPNQTEIYYLIGESAEQLKSNPKLEAARARGIEVLLLTDPVDALWTSVPQHFEGKPLKSLSQGEVDFSLVPLLDQAAASAEAEPKPAGIDEAATIAAVKEVLGERVSEVRASSRLTDSPACLVAGAGFDRELSRLLARANRSSGTKPILELNMRHAIVKALARAKADDRGDEVADLSTLLFEQAKILDGEVPEDPAAFAMRVNRLVMRGLGAS
jgi:molecular chaperone HtpG